MIYSKVSSNENLKLAFCLNSSIFRLTILVYPEEGCFSLRIRCSRDVWQHTHVFSAGVAAPVWQFRLWLLLLQRKLFDASHPSLPTKCYRCPHLRSRHRQRCSLSLFLISSKSYVTRGGRQNQRKQKIERQTCKRQQEQKTKNKQHTYK